MHLMSYRHPHCKRGEHRSIKCPWHQHLLSCRTARQRIQRTLVPEWLFNTPPKYIKCTVLCCGSGYKDTFSSVAVSFLSPNTQTHLQLSPSSLFLWALPIKMSFWKIVIKHTNHVNHAKCVFNGVRTFTFLCNHHHHHPSPEHFCLCKLKLCNLFPLLPSSAFGNHWSTFHLNLTTLGTTYEQTYIAPVTGLYHMV
jgi:hypothetical protein